MRAGRGPVNSPVGRAFVRDGDRPAGLGLLLGGALHQAGHAGFQRGDLAVLPGDDVREILGQPGQMRDAFFEVLHGGAPKVARPGRGPYGPGEF